MKIHLNMNRQKILLVTVLCFAFVFVATAAYAALTFDATSMTGSTTVSIVSTTTSAASFDSGTTGTVNLGNGNNAKTVNLGSGTAGNTINIGTDNTTLDAINVGSALDTVIITGTSAGLSKVELAATRPTGATGSYQTLAGDLTYQGAAGGTSSYHAGVMGNFLGDTLTNTNATIHAGTIGKYSVTTSDALVGPKAGLVGEAETSVANSAVMAVLGGDTGTVTPGAAYGVRYLNSTAASKFAYGLDLFSAAVGSYKAVDYGTADIRLQNGETISNGTDGVVAVTSGSTTFSGDITVTGSDVLVGAAGVKLTGDGDGAITLLGLGDGTDEDLTLNLDDTANTVTVSSSTGVDNLTFTGMRLILSPTFSGSSSRQSVEADATLSSFTGGYAAGAMGHVMGNLAAGNTIAAGLIGKYNVTDGGDSDHPQAGIIGEVGEDSANTADAAVMAVLGGDSGALTATSAYGVRYLNSTAGSYFEYGLDLYSAAIDSYLAVSYNTADIRLSKGNKISTGTSVPTACAAGDIFIDSDSTNSTALLYLCDSDEDGDGAFDPVSVTD